MEGLHVVMKPLPPGNYSLEVQTMGLYENFSEPLVYTITINCPAPALRLAAANGSLKISWPASAAGFALQSTPSLRAPTWSKVAAEVTTSGGTNAVVLPLSPAAASFYRLLKN
jgi:sirohydrochlorin ferrochelatase